MAVENLRIANDAYGVPTFVRNVPEYVDAVALGAASAESVTVPAGANIVRFGATEAFYAVPDDTAAVPGDTSDGSAAEQSPSEWHLIKADGTTVAAIGLISVNAQVVTLSFYKGVVVGGRLQ